VFLAIVFSNKNNKRGPYFFYIFSWHDLPFGFLNICICARGNFVFTCKIIYKRQ
jgi:hypothetical protein